MKRAVTNEQVRDAYRRAAVKLFHISEHEAGIYIRTPEEDKGEWASDSMTIIYLEADCRTEGDIGTLPALLDYYEREGMNNCTRLDEEVDIGTYIEYINAAVAAVWTA